MSEIDFGPFWDLLEEAHDIKKLHRRCPKCDSVDCKYGTHSRKISNCDVSIACNDCRHHETALVDDCKLIIDNWHEQK